MAENSPKTPPTALEYAMKILSKRVYAESEIQSKLQKKGYSAAEIKTAVEDCRRYAFLNDKRYAEDYANLLNQRGCGSLLIRRKLQMLHIAEEYIDNALAQAAENEMTAAKNSLDFKLRMLKNEKDKFKKKQKIYAFLVSRGYSFDIIRELLEGIEF
ncbi:MAG: regulatory protein RecX [Lentisphaeria bacterium]|nr:regulatory protein RecX [Lentisphaeria bacterium]